MRTTSTLLVAALLGIGSCANRTDPVTGDSYYSPIGNDYRSQVEYVRRNLITQVVTVQDGGDLNEPGINAACQEIFRKIVAALPAAHRRDFRFELKLGASTTINAYTYGAGLVRANLGLIAQCEDASEFAGIVAHELGHNSHDHIGQSIGRATVTQEVLGLGGLAGTPGRFLGNFVGGDIASFTLNKYSRTQESVADQRAVEYTSAAGIDPGGLARFFERLEKREKGARPPQLFQTHPYSGNRVVAIREQIAERANPVDGVVQTDAFAKAIQRAREIMPFYEALNHAVESDDLDGVLEAADKGVAALPGHAAFPFWKGVVLATQEKPDEAVLALRDATAADTGTNFLIPLMQQMLELQTGHPQRAIRAANRLIGLMPNMPHGYLVRGLAQFQLDRKDAAFADFDEALQRLPNSRSRRKLRETIEERVPEFKNRDS